MNKAILIGNLGQDPDVGETAAGKRYARLSLATSESWRDKGTGERKERTTWHRVVVWGDGLCAVVQQYAKKGTKLCIEGKVSTREFEKDGIKKQVTEIVVQGGDGHVRLLGRPGEGGAGVPPPDAEPDGWAREAGADG